MRKILFILLLLLSLPSVAANTRGATVSDLKISVGTTDGTITHTVDASTTLLVCFVAIEGPELISVDPTWNTTETMTLIHDTGLGTDTTDVRTYWWGLVSPTAKTDSVSMTFATNVNPGWVTCVNYLGTATASVAAATNFLSEDNNENSSGSTNVHASGGSAGNTLLVGAAAQGQDMTPASNATSYTEIFDTETGDSDTADFGVYLAELLDAAPSAVTITWATNDENCGIHIEIVTAASSSVVPLIHHHNQQQVRQ